MPLTPEQISEIKSKFTPVQQGGFDIFGHPKFIYGVGYAVADQDRYEQAHAKEIKAREQAYDQLRAKGYTHEQILEAGSYDEREVQRQTQNIVYEYSAKDSGTQAAQEVEAKRQLEVRQVMKTPITREGQKRNIERASAIYGEFFAPQEPVKSAALSQNGTTEEMLVPPPSQKLFTTIGKTPPDYFVATQKKPDLGKITEQLAKSAAASKSSSKFDYSTFPRQLEGSSMSPFFPSGSTLTIQKVPPSELKRGDVVFWTLTDEQRREREGTSRPETVAEIAQRMQQGLPTEITTSGFTPYIGGVIHQIIWRDDKHFITQGTNVKGGADAEFLSFEKNYVGRVVANESTQKELERFYIEKRENKSNIGEVYSRVYANRSGELGTGLPKEPEFEKQLRTAEKTGLPVGTIQANWLTGEKFSEKYKEFEKAAEPGYRQRLAIPQETTIPTMEMPTMQETRASPIPKISLLVGGVSTPNGERYFLTEQAEPLFSPISMGGVSEYARYEFKMSNILPKGTKDAPIGRERLFGEPSILEKIARTQEEFSAANEPRVIGGVSYVRGGYSVLKEEPNIQPIRTPTLTKIQKEIIAGGATIEGLPIIKESYNRAYQIEEEISRNREDYFGNIGRRTSQSFLIAISEIGKTAGALGGVYRAYLSGDKATIFEGQLSAREQTYTTTTSPEFYFTSAVSAGFGTLGRGRATSKPFEIEANILKGFEIEEGAARGRFTMSATDISKPTKTIGGTGVFSILPDKTARTIFYPYELTKTKSGIIEKTTSYVGETAKYRIGEQPQYEYAGTAIISPERPTFGAGASLKYTKGIPEFSVSSIAENKPIKTSIVFKEGKNIAFAAKLPPEELIQRKSLSGRVGEKGDVEGFVRDIFKQDILQGESKIGEKYTSLVAIKSPKGQVRTGILRTTIPYAEKPNVLSGGGAFQRYVQEQKLATITKIVQETAVKSSRELFMEEPGGEVVAFPGQIQTQSIPKVVIRERIMTSERPIITEKPIQIERPVTTIKPLITERPITTQRAVTSERPFSLERLLNIQRPIASERPTTFQRIVTVERPLVIERPISVERPIVTQRLTTTERPFTQKPIYPPKKQPPFYPIIPFRSIPQFGKVQTKISKTIAKPTKFQYSPSIIANISGIARKLPKRVFESRQAVAGFEIRPIPIGKGGKRVIAPYLTNKPLVKLSNKRIRTEMKLEGAKEGKQKEKIQTQLDKLDKRMTAMRGTDRAWKVENVRQKKEGLSTRAVKGIFGGSPLVRKESFRGLIPMKPKKEKRKKKEGLSPRVVKGIFKLNPSLRLA